MSLSLCGGLGAGPIASAHAVGAIDTSGGPYTHPLALTLTRDVTCNGVLLVVGGAYNGPTTHATTDNLTLEKITDTAGGTWDLFDIAGMDGKANISNTRQNLGSGSARTTLELCGSGLRAVSAGELHNGDTIDVYFAAANFPTSVRTIAMAFVLTGVLDTAVNAGGVVDYSDGFAYPDEGSPSGGLTSTDFTYLLAYGAAPHTADAECAVVAADVGWGTDSTLTPSEGDVLGAVNDGGGLSLVVTAIPDLAASTTQEPGGTWANAQTAACNCWIYMGLAAPSVGPSLGISFRVAP